jgi:multidrug efflux pump subunit AcrA (membrane-fusion protein)
MLKISNETIQSAELEYKLKALQTLHTPKAAKTLARWLIGIGVFLFVCLFLPWQQNVQGTGSVTALNPQDRPQTIQTAIAGRIVKWHVQEGQFVKANDTILTLSEVKDEYFDPQLLTRLAEQVKAKEDGLAATRTKITALDNNIQALEAGLRFKMQQAQNKLQQSRYKLISDSTDYEAEKINVQVANRQFHGRRKHVQQRPDLAGGIRKAQAQSPGEQRQAGLDAEQGAGGQERSAQRPARTQFHPAEYAKEIAKANSDRSSAVSYLADAEGELSKLRNKLSSVEVRVQQRAMVAPQDGYVVKPSRPASARPSRKARPW